MRTPEQVALMTPAELRAVWDAGPREALAWGAETVRLTDPDEQGWFYGTTYDANTDSLGYGTFCLDQIEVAQQDA